MSKIILVLLFRPPYATTASTGTPLPLLSNNLSHVLLTAVASRYKCRRRLQRTDGCHNNTKGPTNGLWQS